MSNRSKHPYTFLFKERSEGVESLPPLTDDTGPCGIDSNSGPWLAVVQHSDDTEEGSLDLTCPLVPVSHSVL